MRTSLILTLYLLLISSASSTAQDAENHFRIRHTISGDKPSEQVQDTISFIVRLNPYFGSVQSFEKGNQVGIELELYQPWKWGKTGIGVGLAGHGWKDDVTYDAEPYPGLSSGTSKVYIGYETQTWSNVDFNINFGFMHGIASKNFKPFVGGGMAVRFSQKNKPVNLSLYPFIERMSKETAVYQGSNHYSKNPVVTYFNVSSATTTLNLSLIIQFNSFKERAR